MADTGVSGEELEAIEQYIREAWRELRDDASPPMIAHVRGAIAMALRIGVFDRDRAELWTRRTLTCPGHDDEGGRNWCAFCGDMPAEHDAALAPAGSGSGGRGEKGEHE